MLFKNCLCSARFCIAAGSNKAYSVNCFFAGVFLLTNHSNASTDEANILNYDQKSNPVTRPRKHGLGKLGTR